MTPPHGSRRAAWWLLPVVWAAAAGLVLLDALATRSHLRFVESVGSEYAASAAAPRSAAYLPGTVDALVWVRYAEDLATGDRWRVSHTDIDNAPAGRLVQWSSAWAWVIGGVGRLLRDPGSESLTRAIERGTLWVPPLALLSAVLMLSSIFAFRSGPAAGAVLAIGLVGNDYFYAGFLPTQVDHHGVLAVLVLGMVLGIVIGGAGSAEAGREAAPWMARTPADARRAMALSASAGALGVAMSAASVLIPVAVAGIAAALVLRSGSPAVRAERAALWRLWGRVGAAACVILYVVAYAPDEFAWRLEVNHPLYALAWLGGGEAVAAVLAGAGAVPRWRTGAALLAVAAVPAVMLAGGPAVFVLRDPFLAALHRDYITEFWSLWRSGGTISLDPFSSLIGIEHVPTLFAIGWLVRRPREVPVAVRWAVLFAVTVTALSWLQIRWMTTAAVLQIVLAAMLAACALRGAVSRRRVAVVVAGAGLVFLVTPVLRVRSALAVAGAKVLYPDDRQQLRYRHVAGVIRQDAGSGGRPIVLSDPTSSTYLGYYGDFRSVGTLYWENLDGLRAAADIWTTDSDAHAARLIADRGVAYIAWFSDADFIGAYHELLYPGRRRAGIEGAFGRRVFTEGRLPPWLRVIPYTIPSDLRTPGADVRLVAVDTAALRHALAAPQ